MDTRSAARVMLLGALLLPGVRAQGNTTALIRPWCQRALHIVRHFEIDAQPGKPALAIVPAMIPVYGATNWQVIKASHFTFSEPPNSSKPSAGIDKFGRPHHDYQINWNSAKAARISIDQSLDLELTWFNTLYTSARLPYDAATRRRYAAYLAADPQGGINPDAPLVDHICSQILERSPTAAKAVEGVCDWIADNVDLDVQTGRQTSDETLARRNGDCEPVSILACALLRHLGVPCDTVQAKFVETPRKNEFIEVYYPDAGWVFYDISDGNIGFKNTDSILSVGWGFYGGAADRVDWQEGNYCVENDAVPFWTKDEAAMGVLNALPTHRSFSSVRVSANRPPVNVRIRRRPIREILLDTGPATGL
jgi:hypothetical protein